MDRTVIGDYLIDEELRAIDKRIAELMEETEATDYSSFSTEDDVDTPADIMIQAEDLRKRLRTLYEQILTGTLPT